MNRLIRQHAATMGRQVGQLTVVLLVTSAACTSWAVAPTASVSPVQFDVHATGNEVLVVARGQPGATAESVAAALAARLAEVCPGTVIEGPATSGEYPYMVAADHTMVPPRTSGFPVKDFQVVRQAPWTSQRARCGTSDPALAEPEKPTARPLRLALTSRLRESVTYVDQSGLFTDRWMEVALPGPSHGSSIAQAALAALAVRGLDARLVTDSEPHDLRLVVEPGRIPGENPRFKGPALLTKIGAFGITKLSVAYCGIEVHLQRDAAPKLAVSAQVANFRWQPNIYEDWAKEMAAGPRPELHMQTSSLLQSSLSDLVGASLHAISPELLRRLSAR